MIATAIEASVGADGIRIVIERLARRLEGPPDIVVVFASEGCSLSAVHRAVSEKWPRARTWGGTSCHGVFTEEGLAMPAGLALLGARVGADAVGVGSAELSDAPREAGRQAARRALENAGRPGEAPAVVGICGEPGSEERVLEGVTDILGARVPFAGGSAADDTVGGRWAQLGEEALTGGVSVVTWFPDGGAQTVLASGYLPTAHTGRVTAAHGRNVLEIDGIPAREVYDRWTGGLLEGAPEVVLGVTSFHPLGRVAGYLGEEPLYVLSHPERQLSSGGLSLFTEIAVGDVVTLMRGDRRSLVSRAERVAEEALAGLDAPCAGAIVTFCAGCMLAVEDAMSEVQESLVRVLGAPFLVHFSFGEQGCLAQGRNVHGNLMIGVTVFGA